jgi:hypothetical protein
MISSQSKSLDDKRGYALSSYRPILSKYALEDMEGDMRVDDVIRKSVVYVGIVGPSGFVPRGTGFITISAVDDRSYQNVVTARHVLGGIDGDEVYLRINRLDGRAEVIALEREAWQNHHSDKVDLASCPTVIPKDQFDIMHIDVDGEMMFTDYRNIDGMFGLGDEVLIAGMFGQRLGETRNLPIIRTGTIAAMPEEKIQTNYGYHEAYLMELRSIDGLSGSPVFACTSLVRVEDGKLGFREKLTFKFIGVLLGTNEVINHKDFVMIKSTENDNDGRGIRTFLNTGIGIVAPADLVAETVRHPDIVARRNLAAKKTDPERRYRPTSAGAAAEEPSTKADNPQHKEDFNSLLTSVATAKISDDQT